MSAIHDLISQVTDPRLRDRLAAEWAKASKDKKFGLVFEDHLPELLPLHKAKPRRGDLVCRRDGSIKDVWQVQKIKDGFALCIKPGNEADEAPDGGPARDAAAAEWPSVVLPEPDGPSSARNSLSCASSVSRSSLRWCPSMLLPTARQTLLGTP